MTGKKKQRRRLSPDEQKKLAAAEARRAPCAAPPLPSPLSQRSAGLCLGGPYAIGGLSAAVLPQIGKLRELSQAQSRSPMQYISYFSLAGAIVLFAAIGAPCFTAPRWLGASLPPSCGAAARGRAVGAGSRAPAPAGNTAASLTHGLR